jgi:hypothetical protein
VVALLGGCATATRKTIYVKPGVGEEQKKKDEAGEGLGGHLGAPISQDGWGAGRRQKNTREIGWLARDFCADSI